MSFSNVLRLINVDDYISPSQTCIKPVKVPTNTRNLKSITIGEDGSYVGKTNDGQMFTLEKATMNLNDCLACSGCITTADSVLISQHNVSAFLDVLESKINETVLNSPSVIVALSPQSIASLSLHFIKAEDRGSSLLSHYADWVISSRLVDDDEFRIENVRSFIEYLLYQHGVSLVLDTTWSREISLFESANEFVYAWNSKSKVESDLKLPIFTGICPGWVCYAEKTHHKMSMNSLNEDAFLIPHLSRVRSPQQILAGIVKYHLSKGSLLSDRKIYLAFVMPCFDKKLEASRQEFEFIAQDNSVEKETDLVLGTVEFLAVLEALCEKDIFIMKSSISTRPIQLFDGLLSFGTIEMYRHPGSGSGGYAVSVLSYAAKHLFDIELQADVAEDKRILIRKLGNQDLQEMVLFASEEDRISALSLQLPDRTPFRWTDSPQSPLLCFAVVNGFRNIQTLVRQFKKSLLNFPPRTTNSTRHLGFPYDYIEVMACPGGCLNGGAQLKGSETGLVIEKYFGLKAMNVMENPAAGLLRTVVTADHKPHFYTSYKDVPNVDIINSSALQW